jgi:aminoglycoside phosphotransferase (APT) family kinase protein
MVRVEKALDAAFPDAPPRVRRTVETGWDSVALELDGEWILRVARRDVVSREYRVEATLLPELAPALPLPVPVPVRSGDGWILSRRIVGTPFTADADVRPLGELLVALHAFPVERACSLGAKTHVPAEDAGRFRRHVLPLLEPHEARDAERLLEEHVAAEYEPRLTHADLGPEHVLVDGGRITGVIDWTDARIGDPAIDLAWTLQAAPQITDSYPVDAELRRRARIYRALGPWHEVEWGLRGDAKWIESGLTGVRERLAWAAGRADTMSG